jgi:hypothetical protein
MALVISDRIKETTNTVGTQTFQLEGAVTGFETFATNLSDGDTTYYAVTDNTNFEVGLGTINEGASQTINYTVTVVSDGGNKFALNGVTNPVITFVKGFTYVFDVSDSSNGSHPLRFRTSADASYTDGVSVSGTQGQANATVTIVVASDAPSTLKYYCTSHGNAMGNTINVISAVATLARTTILASSNSNNAVSFGSGTKTIFCTLPAGKAVFLDGSGDLTLVGADYNAQWDKANSLLEFKDNAKATFGNDSDLRILHDGSNSFITEAGTGALFIGGNALVQIHKAGSSEKMIEANADGNVELYYDNSLKFETTSSGATVTGTLVADVISIADGSSTGDRLTIGTNNDFFIYHDFSPQTVIANVAGQGPIKIQAKFGEQSIIANQDGSTELYHNNVKKVETTSDGATVTGVLTATEGLTTTGGNSGDVLLTFDIDRTWQFQQSGDNASTRLQLKANTDDKSFDIVSQDGSANFTFFTSNSGTPRFEVGQNGVILFEGATANDFETQLTATDPTADRTITLPDATGTVLTTGNSDTPTTTTSSSDADFVLVDDGGTMKKITPTNLGITAGAASLDDATALAIALG